MPDQHTVLVNRFDPVQGNGMRLTFVIKQFENARAVLWKPDFTKRHKDDVMLNPVVITDDEFAAAEFRVPANAMEEVLNGNHEWRYRLARILTKPVPSAAGAMSIRASSKRSTTQALVTRCGLMRSTPKTDSPRHKAAGRIN